ncbi:hypothetical protein ASG17_07740 [Brevundimonas sp. Leaf363]|uniref:hypothetical protein n=1 Tax=Brevundimonas sp. Leaf363 TaxID=1736353 RepID=UPI0006FD3A87|nr:hypothetical protein [Brevundimonas sp. Leaf363]KQS55934.1 hypothetical protein ASG17_07740 [Brevundimonas sp. Leaf363]
MARKKIYCAQGFWARSGRLEAGEVHQFLNAERALEGADIIARSADGAAAFSLTGEPDVDFWDEPVILASFGTCPRVTEQTQPEAA